ncbi:hypothetical protein [Microbulbifer magnicolonia]|uniref:hypothetical protein n=1 Tax=Microbulbifer magnicolonia TaxID=3109744 RepID=UPI002B414E68|nr:hypothetical protein [Microbulbifer sp. GG15]
MPRPRKIPLSLELMLLAAACAPLVRADGVVVDKVYSPYVQPLEKEIEWRAVGLRGGADELDSLQIHRLGIGRSFSDRWFGEIYLIGERDEDSSMKLQAVELESKWQLTEQGEYAADWGLLFELERERSEDQSEASLALLAARDWGKWSGTANLFAIYEWGGQIDNELESQLRLQGRYRLSPAFEPAVELYAGQDYMGVGPVIRGVVKFEGARQLLWELGLVQGLTDESQDQTLRLLFEYEFY